MPGELGSGRVEQLGVAGEVVAIGGDGAGLVVVLSAAAGADLVRVA